MSRRAHLLDRLRELGADPKRSLGQNFLIADGVIDRILARANEGGPTELIEIGPGLGALTEGLIEIAKSRGLALRAIELDRSFAKYWRDRGIEIVEKDALQVDWRALGMKPGARLVSNLPYQISSSLVVDRSVDPCGLTSMILMFQKEVAKRIAAQPKTDDFGLLTVIAQTGWTISTVSEAGPGDFHPAPRVASRVLGFERRADAPPVDEFKRFLKFVKTAYSHRRKLMVKNLEAWSGNRAALEADLVKMGFSAQARAEELSPAQMLQYFRASSKENI